MKKLFAILLSAFAISATAKENITLYYSWGAGDTAANFYRELVRDANASQDKYNFLFDVKPGAGGTVAANYVVNNSSNNDLLWINSSAGFIRPNLFPSDSHDMSKFRSFLPMCVAPFVVTSEKYSDWKQVPKDANLTIGVSGVGTTTYLVALQIAKQYPNMVVVPFKSTSEALLGTLSGSTDFAVAFFGDSEQFTKDSTVGKKLHWLGITGKHTVKNTQPLANQGFVKVLSEMSTPQQIFAPKSMPEAKFQELRKILVKSANTKSVKDIQMLDSCVSNSKIADKELDPWFNYQADLWKRLTTGVIVQK